MSQWQGPTPQLMSIEELKQWFDKHNFSPNDEVGKSGSAYADPVADAHNERDREKQWDWTFSNIDAEIFEHENGTQITIELNVAYRALYEILPGAGENFHLPLLASVFKEALVAVLNTYEGGAQ